ncbi:GPO family capsid scaffolding protein [Craterilacuibacter sp. RT1T]|uniref:GPO family capsid scaffolding protein n=1 Tax=Craterilacuibacter sp. RT1T TaxID=2942211 RepID=UPI0020C06A4C|nr:GPO family capsid scaffolding protein [Craterilacuibacter sp. RT1T]MCL6262191.1 GPO family capsid scaffolding protein [Craterilacuibacter sp. RT1T]
MPRPSKFFRVATEGATTDGRLINRDWLTQMAASYDPAKYGARVNMEHVRGFYPDSTFRAYGDVLALKAEEVDGKMCLFAQVDPTEDLISLVNDQRQKVYTSIEIDHDFADTGAAYLVGLAITDSPASLGTEMLKFCAGATENPLRMRKQKPENSFTAAEETLIELEAESAQTGESFFARIKAMIGKKDAGSAERFASIEQAVEAIAESQRELVEQAGSRQGDDTKLSEQAQEIDGLKQQVQDLKAAFATLEKVPATEPRQPATGSTTAHPTTF